MPLYEYTCNACDHRFEVLQRMGAGADGLLCPSCGSQSPRRELSTFATATGGDRRAAESCAPGGCDLPSCGSGGCGFDFD